MRDSSIEIREYEYEQDSELQEENQSQNYKALDKYWFMYGVIGFFIPIAGLVLYLGWEGVRPRSSKAAEIGLLLSIFVALMVIVIMVILFLAGMYYSL